MMCIAQILVRLLVWPIVLVACMVSLMACGQTGPLYMPVLPVGVQRATLPQTLRPASANQVVPPAAGASSPSPANSTP